MRYHKRGVPTEKVELQMTPMIDIVFQMLIFFIFTFKVVPTEREIAVNMAPLQAGSAPRSKDVDVIEKIKIKLKASGSGLLDDIRVGDVSLGPNVRQLTKHLTDQFVNVSQKVEDVEVEIDADRNLQYQAVLMTVNAVLGTTPPITNIKFTEEPERER